MIKSKELSRTEEVKIPYWLLPIWLLYGWGSEQTTCNMGSSQKEVVEQWVYATSTFLFFGHLICFSPLLSYSLSFLPLLVCVFALVVLRAYKHQRNVGRRIRGVWESEGGLGTGESVWGEQVRVGGTEGMVNHTRGVLCVTFIPFFFLNLKSSGMCYLN